MTICPLVFTSDVSENYTTVIFHRAHLMPFGLAVFYSKPYTLAKSVLRFYLPEGVRASRVLNQFSYVANTLVDDGIQAAPYNPEFYLDCYKRSCIPAIIDPDMLVMIDQLNRVQDNIVIDR